ncbi:MAG: hypothetical protein EBU93_01560 [Chlamydiae bacterium]|jgi:hypothetical protein|nr:hypothetical protein [Chlamydiota bacterium]
MSYCKILFFSFLIFFKAGSREKDLEKTNLKILHLTFHIGMEKEIQSIGNALGLNITTIQALSLFKDYKGTESPLNITHDKANFAFEKYQSVFDQYDLIITSDTAPLSRIFLQNDWEKKVVVWICNRFDWDTYDAEYYTLFSEGLKKDNFLIIPFTNFEPYYAQKNHLPLHEKVIKPCSLYMNLSNEPDSINSWAFLSKRILDVQTNFDLSYELRKIEVPYVSFSFSNPEDQMTNVKYNGVICFPYQFSLIQIFESMALGLPVYVPTPNFLSLLFKEGYFIQLPEFWDKNLIFEYGEMYQEEFKDCYIYFDSFKDLKTKIFDTSNWQEKRIKIKEVMKVHQEKTLQRWEEVFNWAKEKN